MHTLTVRYVTEDEARANPDGIADAGWRIRCDGTLRAWEGEPRGHADQAKSRAEHWIACRGYRVTGWTDAGEEFVAAVEPLD